MNVDGQVALVSGGASGLGEATARYLAELGADVAILDIDGQRAAQVAADIGGYAQQCDVTDAESVACGVTSAMARFGQAPRMVVCCAGIGLAADIVGIEGKVSIVLFRKVIEVNLLGTYNLMSYAAQAMTDLPELETGERGVIITTTSAAYQDGQSGQAAYAASSGAIASLCLPAAREFAQHGIRVMAIAPGLFDTPILSNMSSQAGASVTQSIPFPQRLGEPMEFAYLAVDIIRNTYLNGTVIRLDGAARLPTAVHSHITPRTGHLSD